MLLYEDQPFPEEALEVAPRGAGRERMQGAKVSEFDFGGTPSFDEIEHARVRAR